MRRPSLGEAHFGLWAVVNVCSIIAWLSGARGDRVALTLWPLVPLGASLTLLPAHFLASAPSSATRLAGVRLACHAIIALGWCAVFACAWLSDARYAVGKSRLPRRIGALYAAEDAQGGPKCAWVAILTIGALAPLGVHAAKSVLARAGGGDAERCGGRAPLLDVSKLVVCLLACLLLLLLFFVYVVLF
jgi:hypothetical protein